MQEALSYDKVLAYIDSRAWSSNDKQLMWNIVRTLPAHVGRDIGIKVLALQIGDADCADVEMRKNCAHAGSSLSALGSSSNRLNGGSSPGRALPVYTMRASFCSSVAPSIIRRAKHALFADSACNTAVFCVFPVHASAAIQSICTYVRNSPREPSSRSESVFSRGACMVG